LHHPGCAARRFVQQLRRTGAPCTNARISFCLDWQAAAARLLPLPPLPPPPPRTLPNPSRHPIATAVSARARTSQQLSRCSSGERPQRCVLRALRAYAALARVRLGTGDCPHVPPSHDFVVAALSAPRASSFAPCSQRRRPACPRLVCACCARAHFHTNPQHTNNLEPPCASFSLSFSDPVFTLRGTTVWAARTHAHTRPLI
jgi:hypothetical protein